MDNPLTRLHRLIVERFSLSELRTLCLDLGINYDDIPGEALSDKARELILKMGRMHQLDQLLTTLAQTRPDLSDEPILRIDPAALHAELSNWPIEPTPVQPLEADVQVDQLDGGWTARLKEWWQSQSDTVKAAYIGLVGTLIVALCGLFGDLPGKAVDTLFPSRGTKVAEVSLTQTPTLTRTQTNTPTATSAPTVTNTPTPTPTWTPAAIPTPEPGSVRTGRADGMMMVYVPGGTFDMGSTNNDERQVHKVTLDSFWIDQTEVTNAQYRKCEEARKCQAPTECDWGEPTYLDPSKAHHPVVCVNWNGARAYCGWVGGRLPTEAEWEYAARGKAGNIYPWGDWFDGELLNFCDRNCPSEWKAFNWDDGYEGTAPVGDFEDGASWCDALDMVGNVREWVNDWYQIDYYAVSPDSNPPGPEWGDTKVLRGGGWNDSRDESRTDVRHSLIPHSRNHDVGFRCVMLPEQ